MSAHTGRGWLVPTLIVVSIVLQLGVVYAPEVPGPQSPIPHSDKAVHALVFALPVLAAGLGGWRCWWVVAVVAVVHAPVSEIIQHLALAHRSGEVWDVVADLAGVGCASIGVLLVVRRLRCRPEEKLARSLTT